MCALWIAAIWLVCLGSMASAQSYTSIVVFGDSLSDTGNVADLTGAKYGIRVPGLAADYADGRFTDGFLTTPASRSYKGVWVEQLAAMLPARPPVKASLDGGKDYAYGFATTGGGLAEFTFGSSDSYFVDVNNIGLQITEYLKTHPKINDKTLFVLWGGAIDVLYASSAADVIKAALAQADNVQRLIDAGATQFLVPNLPPLGDVPRLNGLPGKSGPATEASEVFNDTLAASLSLVPILDFWRRPHIRELNVYGLFKSVIASPSAYGLVDVTTASQGNYLVDPDTYLFWDDLHPTTRGHDILALAALNLVDPDACRAESERDSGELSCETVASLAAGGQK